LADCVARRHIDRVNAEFASDPSLPRETVRSIVALQKALEPERDALRSGALRGEPFLDYLGHLAKAKSKLAVGDMLDLVVDLILETREASETESGIPGTHHFTPTPARLIAGIVKRGAITSNDTVCDLGCGNGRLLVLLGFATGCSGKGVEILPNLATQGRFLLQRNGLKTMTVEHGNAVATDLAPYNVVVMYAPFYANMFAAVVENLEARAQQGPLRVVTHGPMDTLLASSSGFYSKGEFTYINRFDAVKQDAWEHHRGELTKVGFSPWLRQRR
jgi:predicted RNA methylase